LIFNEFKKFSFAPLGEGFSPSLIGGLRSLQKPFLSSFNSFGSTQV
jgi:hypothetical protein